MQTAPTDTAQQRNPALDRNGWSHQHHHASHWLGAAPGERGWRPRVVPDRCGSWRWSARHIPYAGCLEGRSEWGLSMALVTSLSLIQSLCCERCLVYLQLTIHLQAFWSRTAPDIPGETTTVF